MQKSNPRVKCAGRTRAEEAYCGHAALREGAKLIPPAALAAQPGKRRFSARMKAISFSKGCCSQLVPSAAGGESLLQGIFYGSAGCLYETKKGRVLCTCPFAFLFAFLRYFSASRSACAVWAASSLITSITSPPGSVSTMAFWAISYWSCKYCSNALRCAAT